MDSAAATPPLIAAALSAYLLAIALPLARCAPRSSALPRIHDAIWIFSAAHALLLLALLAVQLLVRHPEELILNIITPLLHLLAHALSLSFVALSTKTYVPAALYAGQALAWALHQVHYVIAGSSAVLAFLHLLLKGRVVHLGDEVEYVHSAESLPSRLTFFWFTKLLRVGYASPLEDSHLGRLPPHETTAFHLTRLQKKLKGGVDGTSLGKGIWRFVSSAMLVGGLFRLLADFSGYVAPLGIRTIVAFVEANDTRPLTSDELTFDDFTSNGYVMAFVVLVASLLQATFSQISTFLVNSEGIHLKVALQGLVYEKSLRLGVSGETEGEGSNVLAEDTGNVMMAVWMGHYVWAIPLKLIVLLALLWGVLGVAALVGAAVTILVMIPLQFIVASRMSRNASRLMEQSDERVGRVAEVVQWMRLLKVNGWEFLVGARVEEARKGEERSLDRDLLLRSFMTFLTHISSVVVTLISFGLHPILQPDERLEPPKVFAALALFNQLTVPLFIFPITVPVVIDAIVSLRRIEEYLALPEATPPPTDPRGVMEEIHRREEDEEEEVVLPLRTQPSSDSVFVLENIAEGKEEDEDEDQEKTGLVPMQRDGWVLRVNSCVFGGERPLLSDVSLEVAKGRLTVVVGPTGSGKSLLIGALLGELRMTQGSLVWARSMKVGYASQKPWLLDGSLRDNIVFGRAWRPARYKRVIEATALQPDIDILPDGDVTEIGHKGITLSGGQKQRIAIARALYSNAPFVLLDDPLSALDVEVAQHVLDKGIRRLLLRHGRTVLLVTHHLPVLQHAHHIVAMDKGRVRAQGTLSSIRASDPPLAAEWAALISAKEAELARCAETRTAKERWALLKVVSRIGGQLSRRREATGGGGGGTSSRDVDDDHPQTFRPRKGTFSEYKNLSHDIFLPSDEAHDDLMTPLLRRRARTSRTSTSSSAANTKPALQRMSSLQGDASSTAPSKFSRLQSLPAGDDTQPPLSPRRFRSEMSRTTPVPETLFKRLMSSRKRISSSDSEPPHQATTTSVTSMSSMSEEGDDAVDLLENGVTLSSPSEERTYGTVPFTVYVRYISACGWATSVTYLTLAVAYEGLRLFTNLWLSWWSDAVAEVTSSDVTEYESLMAHYFQTYAGLSLLTVGVSLGGNLVGKAGGAHSRSYFFSVLLHAILRAPPYFFMSTPLGRILARFTSDVAVVDRKLCVSIQRFVQFVLLCVSALLVNALVNPAFIVLALPVLATYFLLQRFYRSSSRELQRLQALARSPIMSHFHETLQGLPIIRAFKQQPRFRAHMLEALDALNRADLFINVGNRWLSISLDFLGSVIVTMATIGALVSASFYPSTVTASLVGLAINTTLLVPVYLNWVVKFLAEVEMFMSSVERIAAYAAVEPEEYAMLASPPPPLWPSSGAVTWDAVTLAHSPDASPTISSLSISIAGGSKVGICGRSGCGKSTLLMSLFRVSELRSGRILIDGVDVTSIPLLRLRKAIAVIPQENVLFKGTLRFNVDPEGKSSDDELWKALDLVQMKSHVASLIGQLDAEAVEDGFSAGQKQLLALARAILHGAKIVVMDEATSSVDAATERILLDVVRVAFADATVLTIAHRLETIATGDRVIVLDAGRVVEDGHPGRLARQPLSHFASMLRQSS